MSASASTIKSLLISLCIDPNQENIDTLLFLFFFGLFLFCTGFFIHFIFVHSAVSVPSSLSLKALRSTVFSMILFLESFIVASKVVRDVFTLSEIIDLTIALSSSVKKFDIA